MANNYNENAIREAAYYLWQSAGCPNGNDQQYWAMAVDQLYNNCNCSNSSSSKKCATSTSTKSAPKKASSASSSKSTASSKKTSK